MTHDNQIKTLPRTKRCPPWETKSIVPDDNYVNYITINVLILRENFVV